jgi:predicted 3-demethylubiquinone-9 3-methyltransferase (glyoxalase superfamily)
MARLHRISPCLWFNREAEEAARFYCGIFPNSRITAVTHYGQVGQEIHGGAPGTVLTVSFELDGIPFTALNGGPTFTFNEAISLQVHCTTQDEIDHYWNALSRGGDEAVQQCGWLKDRYGVSWQVVPRQLEDWIVDSDQARADRVMAALLQMKRLDLAALEAAYNGSAQA